MNQYPGVIGRKVGMTQLFSEDGTVIPCTVVESLTTVVAKRTAKQDGYDALVLGFGERKDKHTSKPLKGFYGKAKVAAQRTLREFRCSAEHAAKYEVGHQLRLDEVFSEGQLVDVQGISRGRGFSGVMRRQFPRSERIAWHPRVQTARGFDWHQHDTRARPAGAEDARPARQP